MSLAEVRRVADAVLYEGYILYPYRASAQKNHSRWQFGVLMPPGYAAADPSESSTMQAEVVFEHRGQPAVEVTVRFLQVQRRTDGATPDTSVPDTGVPDAGILGTGVPAVWDEAVEQEINVTAPSQALLGVGETSGSVTRFTVPGGVDTQTMSGARVIRRREPLTGTVTVRATPLPGPWQAARLTVQVTNESQYPLPSGSPDATVSGRGRPPGGLRHCPAPSSRPT